MLAKIIKIRLRPSPLVVDSEDLSNSVFEVDKGFENVVSLSGPLV
jgi:hypothetical protein